MTNVVRPDCPLNDRRPFGNGARAHTLFSERPGVLHGIIRASDPTEAPGRLRTAVTGTLARVAKRL